MTTEILNSNFDLNNIKYPKNIYALRICDEKGNIYDISVSHNGFCPNIKTESSQISMIIYPILNILLFLRFLSQLKRENQRLIIIK